MNYKLEASAGDHFHSVAEKAKSIANQRGVIVEFEFNGIVCLVNSDTVLDWLYIDYSNSWIMEWKSVGPNCLSEYEEDTQKEFDTRKIKEEEKAESRRRELATKDKEEEEEEALSEKISGIQMEIIPGKEDEYAQYVEKNSSNGYGRAVIDYSEAWAKIMQKQMKEGGKSVAELGDECQNGLGFLGITGFQYGCAVNALFYFWVHGEQLREWHNAKYGISKEKKGVVNPAILTLKD